MAGVTGQLKARPVYIRMTNIKKGQEFNCLTVPSILILLTPPVDAPEQKYTSGSKVFDSKRCCTLHVLRFYQLNVPSH